jgi:uncharacterized protein YkwD
MKKFFLVISALCIILTACVPKVFVSSFEEDEGIRFADITPVTQETLIIPDTGAIPQITQDPESISTPELPVVPDSCLPNFNYEFEKRAFFLINMNREENGLEPLTWNESLATAGRNHSADMGCYRYASHTGRDGSGPGGRILEQGYSWTYFGENIAGGFESAERAVEGWMSSPHHRANILNPNFTEIGVGFILLEGSPYRWYWTADFAAP